MFSKVLLMMFSTESQILRSIFRDCFAGSTSLLGMCRHLLPISLKPAHTVQILKSRGVHNRNDGYQQMNTLVTNSTVWLHFDANQRTVISFVLYPPHILFITPLISKPSDLAGTKKLYGVKLERCPQLCWTSNEQKIEMSNCFFKGPYTRVLCIVSNR